MEVKYFSLILFAGSKSWDSVPNGIVGQPTALGLQRFKKAAHHHLLKGSDKRSLHEVAQWMHCPDIFVRKFDAEDQALCIVVLSWGLLVQLDGKASCPWLGFKPRNAACKAINLHFHQLNCKTRTETGNICVTKSYDPSTAAEPTKASAGQSDSAAMNIFTTNNILEINWTEITQAAKFGGTSSAFITYTGGPKIKNISFAKDNVQSNLPLVSNITTVISNRSQCLLSSNLSLTFRRNKNSEGKDVYCVRLSIEGSSEVWTRDGCQLLDKNRTHVICSCNQMSTFAVLENMKSIETISEIMKINPCNLNTPENGNKTKQLNAITNLLKNMENASHLLAADALRLGEMKIKSKILEVTVQASPIEVDEKAIAQLATLTTTTKLSWTAVKGRQTSGIVSIATIVLNGTVSGMDVGLQANNEKIKANLSTDILTVTISSLKTGALPKPIILNFRLQQLRSLDQKPLCVYWENSENGTGWRTEGCLLQNINGSLVVCQCTHLTSFAVLLATTPIPPADEKNLEKITYIGTALSLVCLLLSLIAFSFCRSTDNVRITIHAHLSLTLFLAEILFVVNFDKLAHPNLCKAVAIILHYLFLACFVWMFLEGVQLYFMVVKVFHSRSLRRKYLYLCGYGVPLVIVGITVGVNLRAYGTENHCWLSLDSGYIWAFLGPVCVILGMNTCFFFITLWKLIGKFSMLSTDVPHFRKVRSFTCTAIAQLVVLGGTWVFGFFHFTSSTIYMSYIFTAANSLQGVFIFVLHCLMSKQVRNEFLNGVARIAGNTSHGSSFTKSLTNRKSESTTNVYS